MAAATPRGPHFINSMSNGSQSACGRACGQADRRWVLSRSTRVLFAETLTGSNLIPRRRPVSTASPCVRRRQTSAAPPAGSWALTSSCRAGGHRLPGRRYCRLQRRRCRAARLGRTNPRALLPPPMNACTARTTRRRHRAAARRLYARGNGSDRATASVPPHRPRPPTGPRRGPIFPPFRPSSVLLPSLSSSSPCPGRVGQPVWCRGLFRVEPDSAMPSAGVRRSGVNPWGRADSGPRHSSGTAGASWPASTTSSPRFAGASRLAGDSTAPNIPCAAIDDPEPVSTACADMYRNISQYAPPEGPRQCPSERRHKWHRWHTFGRCSAPPPATDVIAVETCARVESRPGVGIARPSAGPRRWGRSARPPPG